MNVSTGSNNFLLELVVRLLAADLHLQKKILDKTSPEDVRPSDQTILNVLDWITQSLAEEGIPANLKELLNHVAETIGIGSEIRSIKGIPSSNQQLDKEPKIIPKEITATINLQTNGYSPLSSPGQVTSQEASIDRQVYPSMSTSKTLQVLDRISEIGASLTTPKEEGTPKDIIFQKLRNHSDPMRFVENTSSLLRNYEHLMHMALPNFLFATIEELHKYTSSDQKLFQEILTIPYNSLNDLIIKYLKEAPGAALLKRFRGSRRNSGVDLERDMAIDDRDYNRIVQMTRDYYGRVEEYIRENSVTGLNIFHQKVKNTFRTYSLGPSEVENRLIIVIKERIGELLMHYEGTQKTSGNAALIALLSTIQLLFDVTNFWLGPSRIRKLLEDMKS